MFFPALESVEEALCEGASENGLSIVRRVWQSLSRDTVSRAITFRACIIRKNRHERRLIELIRTWPARVNFA